MRLCKRLFQNSCLLLGVDASAASNGRHPWKVEVWTVMDHSKRLERTSNHLKGRGKREHAKHIIQSLQSLCISKWVQQIVFLRCSHGILSCQAILLDALCACKKPSLVDQTVVWVCSVLMGGCPEYWESRGISTSPSFPVFTMFTWNSGEVWIETSVQFSNSWNLLTNCWPTKDTINWICSIKHLESESV